MERLQFKIINSLHLLALQSSNVTPSETLGRFFGHSGVNQIQNFRTQKGSVGSPETSSAFTTWSPRCVCSSTPPGPSSAGWPGWAQRWRDPGCRWEGPGGGVRRASSRGSSACGPGWRTRPPACWARSTPPSAPPGRCSSSAHRRFCEFSNIEKVEGWVTYGKHRLGYVQAIGVKLLFL